MNRKESVILVLEIAMKKFSFNPSNTIIMKKNYIILSLAFLAFNSLLNAQVVNGNFENVKPNFLPSNWGMNFSHEIAFDPETGESIGDQIQYTWCFPSMVYASTDAHSGQYAMEISNAYNISKNLVITGSATIFSDETQDSPGWNAGIPVAQGANVSMLGFYYKFLPFGNDVAEAKISVLNNQGDEIGRASIDIMGTNNQFMYVYVPIQYTSNASAAFMNITFSMAKEGVTPTFGSRLIIDNVVTNFAALGTDDNPLSASFSVYPTITDAQLNINPGQLRSESIDYKIINMQGKVVKQNTVADASAYVYTMDVSGLSSGMYLLQAESKAGNITKKFIKK